MAKFSQDQIGELGELIAATALSRPAGKRYNRPLFRANRLGGKYPTADFLVDLLTADETVIGFFFAQVKATNDASAAARKRLPVFNRKEKFNELVRLPAPTYLVGVDLQSENTFIVAANRIRRTRISSITKAYVLTDDAVKIGLYNEVRSFWEAVKSTYQSRFADV